MLIIPKCILFYTCKKELPISISAADSDDARAPRVFEIFTYYIDINIFCKPEYLAWSQSGVKRALPVKTNM